MFSKKLFAWIFYAVGSIVTLLSLLGNQKALENEWLTDYRINEIMAPYWAIYISLLLVAAVIMIIRYKRGKNNANKYVCEKCNSSTDRVIYMQVHNSEGISYQYWCDRCYNKYGTKNPNEQTVPHK